MFALASNRGKRPAALLAAALILLTALLGLGLPRKAQAAGRQFTVVLQAGHSPSVYGVGNNQGGERESVLNEQVTLRTYNALKAKGINVILVNPISLDRSLPSIIKELPPYKQQYSYYSPEPAMLTALTWPERFDSSMTNQADLCISLHHNAYSNHDIRGYEIYYASTVGGDYGRTSGDVEGSRKLAQMINTEFAKGFHVPARTPAVRDSATTNGLIKCAPMPAVLVEAGYMSNASDLAALKSAANQQSMADKIAAAVVNYKNSCWTAQDYVDIRTSSLSATYSESSETISVKTALTPAASVSGATMRVYPEAAGPDAARTYELTAKGQGEFSARIGLEPFGFASGKYNITVYGIDTAGRSQLSGTTQVTVTASVHVPEASAVTAELVSTTSNTAVLTVKGASAVSGVQKVEFAVWSELNGQDDLKWLPATKLGSSWVATLRTTDLLDRPGKYIVHGYVTDKRGTRQLVGETSVTFAHKESEAPELCGSVTYRKVGTKLIMTASDVRDASGVKNVRFAFWGTDNEQRDLKWYDGRQSGSSWSAVVTLTDHPSDEDRYTVHVYGTDAAGNDGCMGSLDFRLGADSKAPTARDISVVEKSNGVATVYIEGVEDNWSGVSCVDVAVWSQKNNQDDLRWYKAAPDENGMWTVQFKRSLHADEAGPYHIVVYATDAAKNRGLAARAKFTFTGKTDAQPPAGGTVSTDKTKYTTQTAVVDVNGLTDPSGIAEVTVQVSPAGTASGRTAEFAAAEENGIWRATFSWSRDVGAAGSYVIRAYAADRAGNRGLVGETRVTVEEAAIAGETIMGTSKATVAQLVNMQMKHGGWSNGWYGMTVKEFCQMYFDACSAEGVRAEIAYAQMLHETASLKYGNLVERYQKNFAGLGATGLPVDPARWSATHRYTQDGRDAGIVFSTVEGGIRSQVQHLKGYASTEPLKLAMVPEYDRFGNMTRGCAPTLQLLSMKWASDVQYGDRIQTYVEEILAQSTTMPAIDTKIPSVIEANQIPAAAVPAPSASVKPAAKGESAAKTADIDSDTREDDTQEEVWQAPDPVTEPEGTPSSKDTAA